MQWENHEASKDGKVAPFPVVNIDSKTAPLTQGNSGKVKDQRPGTTQCKHTCFNTSTQCSGVDQWCTGHWGWGCPLPPHHAGTPLGDRGGPYPSAVPGPHRPGLRRYLFDAIAPYPWDRWYHSDASNPYAHG